MSEYDITHVGHEEAQSIINWAVRAGGALQLLASTGPVHSVRDLHERFEEYVKWMNAMVEDMPVILKVTSAEAMEDLLNKVEKEVEDEIVVNQFVEELKDL